ncbi:uncharacterized protein BRD3OS-like [Branchiostoma floridae x Branchiostoma japonicum]
MNRRKTAPAIPSSIRRRYQDTSLQIWQEQQNLVLPRTYLERSHTARYNAYGNTQTVIVKDAKNVLKTDAKSETVRSALCVVM